MSYHYFSRNGELLPTAQAVVPLSNIEYSYGFGVYESLRIHDGVGYFLPQHIERLLRSAATIELEHNFDAARVQRFVQELINKNEVGTANLKILLIGGQTAAKAELYMQCLNPLFPDRQLYQAGATAITQRYQREWPQAKTLNMLPSYLAYRAARRQGAYDALLVNDRGEITEGTRTNFFVMQDRHIIGAPSKDILPGVMREVMLQIANRHDFAVTEQAITSNDLTNYDAAFLTSTSAKIMPLRIIDDHQFDPTAPALRKLITQLDQFLKNCGGRLD